MATALAFDGTLSVSIPPQPLHNEIGLSSYKYVFRIRTDSASSSVRLIGVNDQIRYYLFITPTAVTLKYNSGSEQMSLAVPFDDAWHDFEVGYDGSDHYTILDGGSPVYSGTTSNPDGSNVNRIGQVSSVSDPFWLDYLEFYRNGALHRKWNADLGGTGTTLPETQASSDGTIINGPGDDSQWVTYGGDSTTVTSDLSINWNILNTVNQDLTLSYNILNTAFNDLQLSWDIKNTVTSDKELKWGIRNKVTSDLSVLWNILNKVGSDLSLEWNILNSVLSDLSIEWNIANKVFNDLELAWNTLNKITSDKQLSWNILQSVFSELDIRYDIFNSVENSLSINWNIANTTSSDLTIEWNLESDIVFETPSFRTVVIPSENRVITVKTEPRKIIIPAESRTIIVK